MTGGLDHKITSNSTSLAEPLIVRFTKIYFDYGTGAVNVSVSEPVSVLCSTAVVIILAVWVISLLCLYWRRTCFLAFFVFAQSAVNIQCTIHFVHAYLHNRPFRLQGLVFGRFMGLLFNVCLLVIIQMLVNKQMLRVLDSKQRNRWLNHGRFLTINATTIALIVLFGYLACSLSLELKAINAPSEVQLRLLLVFHAVITLSVLLSCIIGFFLIRERMLDSVTLLVVLLLLPLELLRSGYLLTRVLSAIVLVWYLSPSGIWTACFFDLCVLVTLFIVILFIAVPDLWHGIKLARKGASLWCQKHIPQWISAIASNEKHRSSNQNRRFT